MRRRPRRRFYEGEREESRSNRELIMAKSTDFETPAWMGRGFSPQKGTLSLAAGRLRFESDDAVVFDAPISESRSALAMVWIRVSVLGPRQWREVLCVGAAPEQHSGDVVGRYPSWPDVEAQPEGGVAFHRRRAGPLTQRFAFRLTSRG